VLEGFCFAVLFLPFFHVVTLCTKSTKEDRGKSTNGNMQSVTTLMFETPSTWRTRLPYLYLPRTGWHNCAPGRWVPFSSPLVTRRATVVVFNPPPPHTHETMDDSLVEVQVTLRLAVSQYVLASRTPLGPTTRFYFFFSFVRK
jgi:hypothetical protein